MRYKWVFKLFLFCFPIILGNGCLNKSEQNNQVVLIWPYVGCEGCADQILNEVIDHNRNCKNIIFIKASKEVLDYFGPKFKQVKYFKLIAQIELNSTSILTNGILIEIGEKRVPINLSNYKKVFDEIICEGIVH